MGIILLVIATLSVKDNNNAQADMMSMVFQNLGNLTHILPAGFNPIEFVGDGMQLAQKFNSKLESKLTGIIEPVAEKWEKKLGYINDAKPAIQEKTHEKEEK